MRWVDATDLEQWADRRDSQAAFPDVVRQLVYACAPDARRVEFRTGEGVQLAGWDGYVEAPTGTAHIPEGLSVWEIGTGEGITTKANDDYASRTAEPLGINPQEATFVFATPRRWAGKAAWIQAKRAEGTWRDVRAYDADDLELWLQQSPAVGAWLARKIDKYPENVTSLDDVWNEFTSSTKPPVSAEMVLAGRTIAQTCVGTWLGEQAGILHIKADTTAEAVAFVAAHILMLPVEERDRLRARTLATSDVQTLRALSTTRAPLVILYDGASTGPASVAVQRGHHVLIPLPPGTAASVDDVGLPRSSREAFAGALRGAGFTEEESFVIARETGRSITAFQRRFAVARPARPAWAEPPQVYDLIGLLCAGSWDAERPADREVLVELTGKHYDEVARLATTWTQGADPPLRQAGNIVAFSAVRDAWQLVAPYVTRDALARFATVAERVLSLDDPRLTLPPNERWLSALRGQQPVHSEALREGIARSLALLSLLGSDGIIPHRAQDAATTVVRVVLAPGVSWQRWYSVAGVLSLLAEAAPEAFLAGLEAQLAPAAPELVRLFDEEGGGISSSSKHTHLLWALEILAWDPTYLSRVTLLLGRLARIDRGGRLLNRPINSLREIFLFWHPYTSATLAQRKQALELLIAREPDVAWDLLTKLLPKSCDHGMPTAQPQWRIVSVRPPMTYGERDHGAIHILEHALALAGTNASRLALLVQECGAWPQFLRDRLADRIRAFNTAVTVPDDRTIVWSALRQLINNHAAYPTADWAVPAQALAGLAEVRDLLTPTDLTMRYAWLFDDWWPNLGDPRGDDHAIVDAAVTQARQDAVRAIQQAGGHDGLLALADAVKYPGFLGRDAADVIDGAAEQRMLLIAALGSPALSIRLFGQALVARWHERAGEAWATAMLAAPLTDDQTAGFLLGLPFRRLTWDRLAGIDAPIRERYWREVQVWLPQGVALDDLTFAVERLIEHSRAFIAVHLVNLHLEVSPGALLVRVLDVVRDTLIAGTALPPAQSIRFDLEHIIERLDAKGVDAADIARLEWFFLPLLRHGRLTPTLALHRQMASNPGLFVDVLCAVYRAHNRNPDDEASPTEQDAARARMAYELLSSWHILPGSARDGTIDYAALNAWVDNARARYTAADRAAIGDQHVGQVLAHAPAGADGVWPHPVVRDIIERLSSEHLESGIASGIFNGRGVFAKALDEGGNQERVISLRYRGHADALAGTHPRTAGLLRRIADDYQRYGQAEDERAEQRDLD